MIYLDSAAVIKLVHSERGSESLCAFLDARADVGWVSSSVTEVEVVRALVRSGAHLPAVIDDFRCLLDLIVRVEMDAGIRILAQTIGPPTVPSIDAIHLATGLRLRNRGQLTSFVTCDARLAAAASVVGLVVEMPAG